MLKLEITHFKAFKIRFMELIVTVQKAINKK